jgi:hypothetical protein
MMGYSRATIFIASKPFFEEQQIPPLRILTDCGTEYWGKAEHHEYELYLTTENVEHSKTKVKTIGKWLRILTGCKYRLLF